MTEENKKEILYLGFITVMIMLAVIYFSVPERAGFFKNQLKWWREFKDIFLGFLN